MWCLAIVGSALTSFYMFRVFILTFWGDFRGTEKQASHLHESPWSMTIPLIILAIFSVAGGLINLPHFAGGNEFLAHWLAPLLPSTEALGEVSFFSLEMGKEQLMYRVLSNETEIPNTNLKTGNISKEEWIKLSNAIKKFSSLPIFIDDTTNISIQTIRVQLKKILFEQTKIGLVIIDYLQLMQNSKSKIENRVQELSQITRSLKSIAREFNIPVIALSQLSRNVETRINKRPLLSDLRESGSIEQDADLVLMLFRENYYNSKQQQQQQELAELIIAKHRNGPSGTIELKFNAEFIKFSDYDY